MLKYHFLAAGMITFGLVIMTCVNFWQIEHVRPTLKDWSFYYLKVALFIFIAQVLIWYVFRFGRNWFGAFWPIQIWFLIVSSITAVVVIWLWWGELPSKKSLIALTFWIIGGIINAL